MDQVTMIQMFRKNTGSLMNYKELICLQQTKVLVLISQKGVLCEWEKKIWKSLLGEKHLLGKPVHFSVKNTVNNADTWELIQQFFQHLYHTANSIVHFMAWVKTEQILWYKQQHISLRRIQFSRIILTDNS